MEQDLKSAWSQLEGIRDQAKYQEARADALKLYQNLKRTKQLNKGVIQ